MRWATLSYWTIRIGKHNSGRFASKLTKLLELGRQTMKLKTMMAYILWVTTTMGASLWVVDPPLWAKDTNRKSPAVIMRRKPVQPLKPVAPIPMSTSTRFAHGVSINNWIRNQKVAHFRSTIKTKQLLSWLTISSFRTRENTC